MGNCCSVKRRKPITPGPLPDIDPGLSLVNPRIDRNKLKKNPIKSFPSAGNLEAPNAFVSDEIKTQKDREEIKRALKQHFVFNNLTPENFEMVIEEMKLYSLGPRETVFHQGEEGTKFFIVSSGKLEVLINGTVRNQLTKGQGFGELALMHGSKRSATVRTVEKVTLWGIDRDTFRNAIKSISQEKLKENKAFIDSIPMFNLLLEYQKENLLNELIVQDFPSGQKIVVEGDVGDLMYIIKEGSVLCSRNGIEIREMNKGDFFGEQALLYSNVRTATITTLEETSVLSLSREGLNKVLGDNIQKILYKNSIKIAMEKSDALKALNASQIERVIEEIEMNRILPGQKLVKPKGKLWIILKGGFLKSSDEQIEVFDCIGDTELLEDAPMFIPEEIRATSESDIAEIDHEVFEACIGGSLEMATSHNEVIQILKQVHLLRTLPIQTIERLVSVLELEEYSDDETIFFEDGPGDSFYIVKEGQVDIYVNNSFKRQVGRHDYFGERAILLNENRTATVKSRGRAVCWVLNRADFLDLVDEGIRVELLKRMDLQDDSVTLLDLKFVRILGKGMFGNVFLTIHSRKHILYALKTVQRSKIAAYDIYENIELERLVLLELDHPLIVKLVKTFKDEKRLYFLMEFVQGMDLFDVLRVLNLLDNENSKFYTACLILILEHLHERHIIYRDLKPENVMIDENGYPKLIDFGTAKIMRGRTYTIVGTPHYMAPEVIVGKGYGLAADFWSVGIMVFEFICGMVPFGEDEDDPYRIYEKVLENKLVYPPYVNRGLEAKSIIEKLISKNPSERGTYSTIKEHSWFVGVNWERILGKEAKSPYVPKLDNIMKESYDALKKTSAILDLIEREENRESVDIPRHKEKAPPVGWDDEF